MIAVTLGADKEAGSNLQTDGDLGNPERHRENSGTHWTAKKKGERSKEGRRFATRPSCGRLKKIRGEVCP